MAGYTAGAAGQTAGAAVARDIHTAALSFLRVEGQKLNQFMRTMLAG